MPEAMQFKSYEVQHVTLRCSAPFAAVYEKLLTILPRLDPGLQQMLASADTAKIEQQRATGPKLWLFHELDHGILLKAEGRSANALQLHIGNPLTAESMTRHQLGAALYAPLRVLLHEDADGTAIFEYDLPSTFFGQFGDPAVAAVGVELDRELASALRIAALG